MGGARDSEIRERALAAGIALVQPILYGHGKKKSTDVLPYPPGCVGAGGFRPELFTHRNWTHSWEVRTCVCFVNEL